MHDGLLCVAHGCGCRFDRFVWVNHSRKATWLVKISNARHTRVNDQATG